MALGRLESVCSLRVPILLGADHRWWKLGIQWFCHYLSDRLGISALSSRHRSREEREVDGSAYGELAVAEAGAGAPERAGYYDYEGPARPRHHRRAPGLRPAAVRGGRADDGTHTAARWPLVHNRPPWQARARADRAGTCLGQGGNRCRRRNCVAP